MTAAAYEQFRTEAYALAGGLNDLARRAGEYRRLYRASGGRNVFPLIAAHGTLWGASFFRKGMLGARVLALPYLLRPAAYRAKVEAVTQFCDRFRDINRRVFAESHALYHYTRLYGASAAIRAAIGDEFAELLGGCHLSTLTNTHFPQHKRARLFAAFIAWEQEHVVSPRVDAAFAEFDWPLVARLALSTTVRFAFFRKGAALRFENFAAREERLARGLDAYRQAEETGLAQVESALELYWLKPQAGAPAAVQSEISVPSNLRNCASHCG